MKFGHNLLRNKVPEWSAEYIDYKCLKKIINSATEKLEDGRDTDLSDFFTALDRNLEIVDTFYNQKFKDAARYLELLSERYHLPFIAHSVWPKEELNELAATLLELRSLLRKLKWYGEVNRRGFVKITKKLDKKVPASQSRHKYISSCVDPRPFATNIQLTEDINTVNETLLHIADLPKFDNTAATVPAILTGRLFELANFLSAESLKDIDLAIETDNASTLEISLANIKKHDNKHSDACQKLFLSLLHRAISCRAQKSITILLALIDNIEDEEEFNYRNCIHRLVISVGRSYASRIHELTGQPLSELDGGTSSFIPGSAPLSSSALHGLKEVDCACLPHDGDHDAAQLLDFMLAKMTDKQKIALAARDIYGRQPLHYAAKFGFVETTKVILDYTVRWALLDFFHGLECIDWQDLDSNSPLHFSVIGGWRRTTEVLLAPFQTAGNCIPWGKANNILLLATKLNFFNTAQFLLKSGADLNFQDDQGETAIHIAAHFGYEESGKVLLESRHLSHINLEIVEKTFGWTPLIVACVNGQFSFVNLLIEAGANIYEIDLSGWTAKEHAALRGYLDIVDLIAEHERTVALPVSYPKVKDRGFDAALSSSSLEQDNDVMKASGRAIQYLRPSQNFANYQVEKETMVLIGLGSLDPRKSVKPVVLDNIPFADAHANQLDTALSVVVSAFGATGEPAKVDLPIQDNISTDPIAFKTTNIDNVKLYFDIVPTYAGTEKQSIGRGITLLSTIRPTLGSKRMNLQGDVSIPVVNSRTLEYMGSVQFNFMIVTPFSHPNKAKVDRRSQWKKLSETMIIGHRGLGMNDTSQKSLQLGENTIQSFVAAANFGASYVEFDVQLTKDHVPIIYHDFLVSETGIDSPVHSLTLDQFLHVNNADGAKLSHVPFSTGSNRSVYDKTSETTSRKRANSWSSARDNQQEDVSEQRMRHTRDVKLKGFKANSRGKFIQAPFTTLEEMLLKLPEHIGFNIEVKYPMIHEAEEQEIDLYAIELNLFVDTILKKIFDLGQNRNIVFSSFHPDVCLLLSLKQSSIPVLFLTPGGVINAGDVRSSSVQEAIRFAKRWNLLGIVSLSDPLVACPRLIRVVKESGLVCLSFGVLNNDPVNVQSQIDQGIDAVIVDHVLTIKRGLSRSDNGTDEDSAGSAYSNNSETAIEAIV